MCDRSLDVVHGLPDQCRLTEVEARTGGRNEGVAVRNPVKNGLHWHKPFEAASTWIPGNSFFGSFQELFGTFGKARLD